MENNHLLNLISDLSTVKVGQKIWCPEIGETEVLLIEPASRYPIHYNGGYCNYKGIQNNNLYPTIFRENPYNVFLNKKPQQDYSIHERILNVMELNFQVSPAKILGNDRHRAFTIYRFCLSYLLYKKYGYQCQRIADLYGMDHTSVVNHCKRFNDWLDVKDELATRILRVVQNAMDYE